MAVQVFHVGVRLATVIDVMRTVAAAAPIQAQAAIDVANAQDASIAATLCGFEIRDAFAGIFGDLPPAPKGFGGKAAFAIDSGFLDSQPRGKLKLHQKAFYDRSV